MRGDPGRRVLQDDDCVAGGDEAAGGEGGCDCGGDGGQGRVEEEEELPVQRLPGGEQERQSKFRR